VVLFYLATHIRWEQLHVRCLVDTHVAIVVARDILSKDLKAMCHRAHKDESMAFSFFAFTVQSTE
jgi:hypothetical protein